MKIKFPDEILKNFLSEKTNDYGINDLNWISTILKISFIYRIVSVLTLV